MKHFECVELSSGLCFVLEIDISEDPLDLPNWIKVDGMRYVPERTCRNDSLKSGSSVFYCSECGTHIDIALMDSCDDYWCNYCPSCGAKVVK